MLEFNRPIPSELAEKLCIDATGLEERKALLDFTVEDERLLRRIHQCVGTLPRDFIDAFYVGLENTVEGVEVFADRAALEALKDRQLVSFASLTDGEYGLDYARDRIRIGTLRYRHGLKPEWYRGLYTRYLAALAPRLWTFAEGDPATFSAMLLALNKVILLDLGLMIDAYFHADNELLRLLAKVFESEFEGVVIANGEQGVVHANERASELLLRTSEALLTAPLSSLFASPEAFAEPWRLAGRPGGWSGELLIRRGDGLEFPAAVSIGGVHDDAGAITHFVMEFSDITERVQAQAELVARTEELSRSNRDLEQFAYVASHDLQEPLRMVASYTQLLARRLKGRLEADEEEFIGYAVDGARRMQALINDLLAFSRIGTRGKAFSESASAAALERAISNLRVVVEENNALITHDPLPTVSADPVQLAQLFQNLIGNGIKYRRAERPMVHVSATRAEEAWVFSVRDNGIGIDPAYADRIFEIFQRLHTKEEYPGTGIGLAIAKKIVERHGGRIWLESALDSGSTFYFSLPAGSNEGASNDI